MVSCLRHTSTVNTPSASDMPAAETDVITAYMHIMFNTYSIHV